MIFSGFSQVRSRLFEPREIDQWAEGMVVAASRAYAKLGDARSFLHVLAFDLLGRTHQACLHVDPDDEVAARKFMVDATVYACVRIQPHREHGLVVVVAERWLCVDATVRRLEDDLSVGVVIAGLGGEVEWFDGGRRIFDSTREYHGHGQDQATSPRSTEPVRS